jgi:hypothetical protein
VSFATALLYARVVGFDFVTLDDPAYGPSNPKLGAPLGEFISWAFTNADVDLWSPMTWLSLRVDLALSGGQPWSFHLQNALWHAVNAGLVFALALRFLRLRPGKPGAAEPATPTLVGASAAAALLFSLHPLRVESVAWVTERKDVLLGLLSLLATHAWCTSREVQDPASSRRARRASILLLAMAIMSKPTAVAVPFAWVLLDLWPYDRRGDGLGARLARVAPHLLLAATGAAVALTVAAGTVVGQRPPLAVRLLVAAHCPAAYAKLTLWPTGLHALYPFPDVQPFTLWRIAAAGASVAVTVAALQLRRRAPGFSAAWLAWLVLLAPSSGLVQIGGQELADRFTYLPAIPAALLAGGGLVALLRSRPRWIAPATVAVAGVLVLLSSATWSQQEHWRNGMAVWDRLIRYEQRSGRIWAGRALELSLNGRFEEALGDIDRAIAIAETKPYAPIDQLRLLRAGILAGLGRASGAANPGPGAGGPAGEH